MTRRTRSVTPEPSGPEDLVLIHTSQEHSSSDLHAARNQRIIRLRLLWSRRQFLFRCALYGLVASLIIAVLIPSRYESTTRLMPPDSQQGQGLASMLAAFTGGGSSDRTSGTSALEGLAGDALSVKTSGDLFVGVLESRTVRDDLIQKFDLLKVYHKRHWEDARKVLDRKTDLSNDRKSGIITIRVTDKSPQRAAAMAKEYVSELNLLMIQLNTSSAHRERVFLEERLGQVKQDLASAEKDFSQFASNNVALDIPAQGKAIVEATAALQGELIATQTELEGLKQIYTDTNVRVRSAQARVDELQNELEHMSGGPGDSESSAGGKKAKISSAYPTIRKLPLLGVGYADLLRRTKIQEAIFVGLTQQYESAKVQEAKELPTVKVLDAADIPEEKTFPPRALITVLGGILALAAAAWWILASQRWHDTDPTDAGAVFAREVLDDLRRPLSRVSNGHFANARGRIWNRRKTEGAKPSASDSIDVTEKDL